MKRHLSAIEEREWNTYQRQFHNIIVDIEQAYERQLAALENGIEVGTTAARRDFPLSAPFTQRIVRAWIERLCRDPLDLRMARERLLYARLLLLYIREGALADPFIAWPPKGPILEPLPTHLQARAGTSSGLTVDERARARTPPPARAGSTGRRCATPRSPSGRQTPLMATTFGTIEERFGTMKCCDMNDSVGRRVTSPTCGASTAANNNDVVVSELKAVIASQERQIEALTTQLNAMTQLVTSIANAGITFAPAAAAAPAPLPVALPPAPVAPTPAPVAAPAPTPVAAPAPAPVAAPVTAPAEPAEPVPVVPVEERARPGDVLYDLALIMGRDPATARRSQSVLEHFAEEES